MTFSNYNIYTFQQVLVYTQTFEIEDLEIYKMPIYEYECSSCQHHFDLIQKISDEPEKKCPSCLQDTAVKLISAAGFQLKGSGWYVTDFKDKKSSNATPQSDKTEANAPKKDEAGVKEAV